MPKRMPKLLPPDTLEELAAKAPPMVNLWEYKNAMEILREKDYSYQDVADWLNERLGSEVTRNQVAYVLNAHPMARKLEEEQEEGERMADEAEAEKYQSK